MIDAALVGFDNGELIMIPSLHAIERWNAFEAACGAMAEVLSRNTPASRYVKQ